MMEIKSTIDKCLTVICYCFMTLSLTYFVPEINWASQGEKNITLNQETETKLKKAFSNLCWVAYSPTNFDPTQNKFATEEQVRKDLQKLRNIAKVQAIVTYGSNHRNPQKPDEILDIPKLVQEAGFKAMIVGVWEPTNEEELQAAENAAQYPVVIGYSVGNEGLNIRYDLETLSSTINRLRQATGKPITTTEEAHDYLAENSPLWDISDWIFPNVHAYFANIYESELAVNWTVQQFNKFRSRTDKPLIFKEVGLPSNDGTPELNESDQAQFYQKLQKRDINYIVFEAFDQYWKHLPSNSNRDPEPHWGIFRSDRSAKLAATQICRTS